MLTWLLKIFAAILVWAIATLLIGFVGGLLQTVANQQIQYFGDFLKTTAGLIGFLIGAGYFIWGTSITFRK